MVKCATGTVLLTRDAHSCEYDNNGNIVYVNTSRVKPDMTTQPDTVQRAREERFRLDEENRLTALSQNGYVSHYWYDTDGERTVKMHGGNQAVFVNGTHQPGGAVSMATRKIGNLSTSLSARRERESKRFFRNSPTNSTSCGITQRIGWASSQESSVR